MKQMTCCVMCHETLQFCCCPDPMPEATQEDHYWHYMNRLAELGMDLARSVGIRIGYIERK